MIVKAFRSVAPAPPPPKVWSLDDLKADLKAHAESLGIDVRSSWNKSRILQAIQEHEDANN